MRTGNLPLVTAAGLPPMATIDVRVERTLQLARHPDGRPPHLAAASGIVHAGGNAYVVADDELHLGVFPVNGAPGELRRILPGTLPADPKGRKHAKPDFEALTLLPASQAWTNGALLGVGSGSKPNRNTGFVWGLDERGALQGEPRAIDLSPLYDELGKAVSGRLNIEGIAVRGNEALLFHRGNSEGGRNAVARVAAERLIASATDGTPVESSALRGVVNYDLGSIDGVPLTFADARGLPDGRVLFLASAERTDDPVGDGPIAGSAIGVLAADGSISGMWRVGGPPRKLEGIDVSLDDRGRARLTLVTDADDAARPAEVLGAALPDSLEQVLAASHPNGV